MRAPATIALAALSVTAAQADEVRVHRVSSEYQRGETAVRVLLPDSFDAAKRYRVLYVLPVVEHSNDRYGDGLQEIRKLDLHNHYDLICAVPEFSSLPWFADHDGDPSMRDESYFLRAVLPLVESGYPVVEGHEGRLLVGFSKSGWGALSLLLRHPDVFHRVAGWDVGIRIDTGPIDEVDRAERIARDFGSPENFERYRLSRLLRERGAELGEEARIFYYNTGGNRAQGGAMLHDLMVELGIAHRYLYEPKRRHRWDSGWLAEAVRFVVGGDERLLPLR